MKISFITTVYNEEKTIKNFLDSLLNQTKLPNEIIITDGGSKDDTIEIIKKNESKIKSLNIKFKLLKKPGNRSVGRNEAIKHATSDIIACSDAGNILDKKWIENITKPFKNNKIDVVAGYYQGKPQNIFQKCLIPYTLVMPDKVNPQNFLPATRSIAFKKLIWKKIGGFRQDLSHNEDYAFANQLKKINTNIFFAKDAIVYWIPRQNFRQAFIMFFRFAFGDAEAKILRSNVLLLFARYTLALYLTVLIIFYKSKIGAFSLLILLILYIIWSIQKNYKYINEKLACMYLPLMQFTADAAVLSGTSLGLLKLIKNFNYILYLKKNKFLFLIIICYTLISLLTIKWGTPNQNHPFPYHMDEWHQLGAVVNTYRYGTPNTQGSANGTMFHFLFTGFYLIPFMLTGVINPFELQIDNPFMRERVFEVLRLQTIIFGVLSIFVLYKIAKLLSVSKKLAIFLFTFCPIWLMLSGYFKYDIALIFWILLSLLFLFRFAKDPSGRNFILAAIPSGLAFAVKVSAIPLLIIYIVSYFWFNSLWKKNLKYLFGGISVFFALILLFGFPDTLFGRGNIVRYLNENLVLIPSVTSNFEFGMNPYVYLFTRHYPVIFGHGIFFLFLTSCLLYVTFFLKKRLTNKSELFLYFCLFLFLFSILPLKIFAGGNRSLVLLPFMVLIIASVWKKVAAMPRIKFWATVLVSLIFGLQVYIAGVWIYTKTVKSTQEITSSWIINNIPHGTTIGIENVPIYQNIPDILQKEFYFAQYEVKHNNRYTYQIVEAKSKSLPKIIVITGDDIEKKLLRQSPKNDLIERLNKEKYRKKTFFLTSTQYLPFMNDVDYYFSWMVTTPQTISVYIK